MAGTWVPNISYIADLVDRVSARDTNRPLQQLDQRTQYLFDLLQTIASGELIVAKNVTLDSSTIAGTPVYFDDATNTFKPGIAEVDISAGNNYGFPSDASVIRGVVLIKYGATAGDVALYGKISSSLWNIDWTQVIDTGSITPGIHYLSSASSGKMTRSRSHLSVYIGNLNSSGDMILAPQINGNLRDHLHYRFSLLKTVVADTSAEGWAPAAEFPNAPVGATYGYVIQQNAGLAAVFPPVPVDACSLEYSWANLPDGSYEVNADGIWWKSATAPDALAADPSLPGYTAHFVFWVTRLNFGASFVSSLDGLSETDKVPVTFVDANGNPATSGALKAYLSNIVVVQPAVDEGGTALKTLDGVKASFGPVISRLFAGSGVTLEGAYGDDEEGWYGAVTITAGSSAEITGLPILVSLDNAAEDFYGNLPVITFPELRVSSVYMKVNVPTNIPTGRKIKLVLDIIGVGAGGITLNVAYNKVSIGAAIDQTEISLTALTPTLIANQAVRATTDSVDVSPGDTVFFRVTQPNGALANAVPLLRIQYSIART